MLHTITPIATARTPYKQKFGVARQPGLVPAAEVCIELNPEFTEACVRGLDEFDYVWISFIFHDGVAEGWAELVRPPRLGGKQKVGVFATRSPHRPNHLGLSLLKLERIELGRPIKLYCSGADLLDGTPIIDIKPYIPFVEAQTDAPSGFVQGAPPQLRVVWQTEHFRLPENTKAIIEQCLAQDPRPAYQDLPERVYGMELAGVDVKFRVVGEEVLILQINELA